MLLIVTDIHEYVKLVEYMLDHKTEKWFPSIEAFIDAFYLGRYADKIFGEDETGSYDNVLHRDYLIKGCFARLLYLGVEFPLVVNMQYDDLSSRVGECLIRVFEECSLNKIPLVSDFIKQSAVCNDKYDDIDFLSAVAKLERNIK